MKTRFSQRGADALRPLRRETAVLPEDRDVATLLGHVDPLPPASEIAEVRIRRTLEAPRGSPRWPFWFRATVAVAAFLFLIETAAAAAISVWPALHDRFWTTVAVHLPSSARSRLREVKPADVPPIPSGAIAAATPNSVGSLALSPAPSVVPPALPVASQRRSLPRPIRAVPTPAPTPAVRAMPTAEAELALYSRAMAQLNVEHEPAAALGTLSVYGLRYPNGILRGETFIAQIKAELMLGLDTEVLGLLDAMDERAFAALPQAGEVRLLRAELLARVGRCTDALGALRPHLGPSAPADQRGRALFLRADCRSHLGDPQGSREDLDAYLREFPQGPYAPRATEMLHRLR